MNRITFLILILIMITSVAEAAVAGKGTKPEQSSASGAAFLSQWQAVLPPKEHKFYEEYTFIYQKKSRKWGGAQTMRRAIIRPADGKENLFGALDVMKDIKNLRNVEAIPDQKDTYSLVLLGGLMLVEGQKSVTLDAKAICQNDQGLPRRSIFTAEAPKGWAAQIVRAMFTWDYHKYGEDFYWVPVEILTECLVRRGPRQAVISESWALERILEVRKGGVQIWGVPKETDGERHEKQQ